MICWCCRFLKLLLLFAFKVERAVDVCWLRKIEEEREKEESQQGEGGGGFIY